MNFRSFTSFKTLIAAAFAALAFASAPAAAQGTFNAVPSTGSPGTGSFGGGASLVTSGSFGGNAGGRILKGMGEIKTGSQGYLQLESTLSGTQNGCPGGCAATQGTFQGAAGLRTVVEGQATGPNVWMNTGANSGTSMDFRYVSP